MQIPFAVWVKVILISVGMGVAGGTLIGTLVLRDAHRQPVVVLPKNDHLMPTQKDIDKGGQWIR